MGSAWTCLDKILAASSPLSLSSPFARTLPSRAEVASSVDLTRTLMDSPRVLVNALDSSP